MSIIRRIKISKITGKELSQHDKDKITLFNSIFDNTYVRTFKDANILNVFDKNDSCICSIFKNGFGYWCVLTHSNDKHKIESSHEYNSLFQHKYDITYDINFIWQGNLSLKWIDDLNDEFIHQQS